jgi:hypothetical protein
MNQEPGWLFRQSDLILGPVPAKQIIDKLYSGEISPETEVQIMGTGFFTRLAEVAEFKVHVAKAQAKMRVDSAAAEHSAAQRSRLLRIVSVTGGVLLAIGIAVAVLGNYIAVHGGKSAEELAWGDITIDAPTISKARRAAGDDFVDYTHTVKKPPVGSPGVRNPGVSGVGKPKPGTEDAEGLQMGEVDEAGINAVVAKNKPTLIGCIKSVARPDMPATKIPIEFAISEAGKVTKVWVDNPDFKDTGLQDCLLKELQKWPFKAGPSGASVNLSFNIGKRG